MKLHEYQAARLFKEKDIPVPPGRVAREVYEAVLIAEEIKYPVVLKAQVLVGGRGKAGGVRVVRNKEALEEAFYELKQLVIKGYPVERVYVVKAVDIKREYYMAVTVDPLKNDVVLIVSAQGGVDIEEVARTNPDAIRKFYLGGRSVSGNDELKSFISNVFDRNGTAAAALDMAGKLIGIFFENDCSLAEINPLVETHGREVLAADAKVILDENALYRHPGLEQERDLKYEDADELEAKQNHLSFVKLDGNVGCVVNGAGLAMATMDIVKLSGGQPANFLDVGGSSNPEKVLNALRIILRNPSVKAVLINIFGGITRCDDIARGILTAREQIDVNVPLVVRLTGTNEEEAKQMLSKAGIDTHSTMREAVDEVVRAAQSVS